MEEKFVAACLANRQKAVQLGIRMRPVEAEKAMDTAHRWLSGSRESEEAQKHQRSQEQGQELLHGVSSFFIFTAPCGKDQQE